MTKTTIFRSETDGPIQTTWQSGTTARCTTPQPTTMMDQGPAKELSVWEKDRISTRRVSEGGRRLLGLLLRHREVAFGNCGCSGLDGNVFKLLDFRS